MTDQIHHEESLQETVAALKVPITIALSISFGVTLLLFSVAYTRDLNTLARAPELIWAFICGAPSDSGIVLPLLLTISTLALFLGFGLWGFTWLRARRG
jgi:hypothetical protein